MWQLTAKILGEINGLKVNALGQIWLVYLRFDCILPVDFPLVQGFRNLRFWAKILERSTLLSHGTFKKNLKNPWVDIDLDPGVHHQE